MSSNFKAREKLYKAKKKPEESIKKWITRLEHLAEECGFDQGRQGMIIRDLFVIGLTGPVKNKLYKEIDKNNRISLSKLQELALQDEYVRLAGVKTKKKTALDLKEVCYEDDEGNEISIQYRRQGVAKPKPKAQAAQSTSFMPKAEPAQMVDQYGFMPMHVPTYTYPY